MPAVAPLLAGLVALGLAPRGLRVLAAAGLRRPNYRGAELPWPAGVVVAAAALVALGPLAALDELAGLDVLAPATPVGALYVVGVALLGLVDDLLGDVPAPGVADAPRGLRGHGSALRAGAASSGALKAAGTLGLALLVLADGGSSAPRYLLEVAVLVLATHALNLLDLRPGRAIKALALLVLGLELATRDLEPLRALGVWLGPALVVGALDLRERAMLGDTGSNLLGALAGLWLVGTLGAVGLAVALGVLVALTAYGEVRSLSALIERTPLLRQLDSIGRPLHA